MAEAYDYRNLVTEHTPQIKRYFALVNTGTIDRYRILWGERPTKYIKKSFQKPIIPGMHWEKLSEKRRREARSSKIIIGGMTKILECAYDSGGVLAGKSTSIVISDSIDLRYLLGVLNSRLMSYYYMAKFADLVLQGGYLRIGPPQLKQMPIHQLGREEKPQQDKMVALVERMLELHKRLKNAEGEEEEDLERKIERTDRQIDELVYELYGITEEERKIIEDKI